MRDKAHLCCGRASASVEQSARMGNPGVLPHDLSGLPPTYLVTGGFDPLRDEGELFARRLAQTGVGVTLRREPDLIHGFANMLGISVRCREAVAQAAGALRVGLEITTG